MDKLSDLGRYAISQVQLVGRFCVFSYQGVIHLFSYPFQYAKIIDQVYFIGVKSIFVIVLTGVFTGMVLGLQGYHSLVQFGAEGMLGAAVSLSLVRELGPVLTGIMVIGRAGSSMAAEIGIMRISEQIDALDTMDIDPVRYLVSPRLGAALICFPLLTAIFNVVGILGGYFSGCIILGINPGIYMSRVASSITFSDVAGGFMKSLVFAVIVVLVCCFKGFFTHFSEKGFGAKGVSFSTTSAVVVSSVLVFVSDYLLTYFLL